MRPDARVWRTCGSQRACSRRARPSGAHARHILSDAPSAIAWYRDHMAMGVLVWRWPRPCCWTPTGTHRGPLEDLMFRIYELCGGGGPLIEPPAGVAVPRSIPNLLRACSPAFPPVNLM